jgi:hypothetical protein
MAESPSPASPSTPATQVRDTHQPANIKTLPLFGACGCGSGCACGCQSGNPCQCG